MCDKTEQILLMCALNVSTKQNRFWHSELKCKNTQCIFYLSLPLQIGWTGWRSFNAFRVDWILCGPDGLDGAPSMLLESILGGVVGVPYHQLALKDAMAVLARPIAAKASHFS